MRIRIRLSEPAAPRTSGTAFRPASIPGRVRVDSTLSFPATLALFLSLILLLSTPLLSRPPLARPLESRPVETNPVGMNQPVPNIGLPDGALNSQTAAGAPAPAPAATPVEKPPPIEKTPPAVLTLTPADDLKTVVTRVAPNTILRLSGGHYELSPEPYLEETCGNCLDPQTRVEATVGLKVTGRSIAIVGDPTDPAVIHTRSGYGILFEDCTDCRLEGVTITDGIRDADVNATDAGVVVKRSRVRLVGNRIVDNLGDSTLVQRLVVGIMGVTGREGADITLVDCQIIRNSWDGVALYRGSKAILRNNVVDGVDRALGARHGGGRGVGIGLTWDSVADIRGNYVARYWKGIGVFGAARGVVEENIVEDMAAWGLTLWDGGRGHPSGIFRGNVVFKAGACGASISATPPPVVRRSGAGAPPPPTPAAGCLIGNAFVRTGQNPRYDSGEPFCTQTAIARDIPRAGRDPIFFPIESNLFYRNRESEGQEGRNDQAATIFRDAVQPLVTRLERWSALKGSGFLREFSNSNPTPTPP